MSIFGTILLIFVIYYVVGMGVIFFISSKTGDNEGGAHWCIIYAFGPFLWPLIVVHSLNKK